MVGAYEVAYDLGQVVLVGQFETLGDVADDDLCRTLLGKLVVGVDTGLVLGKEGGVEHFAYVVIQGTGTHELGLSTYLSATSAARLATCNECTKVPCATFDMRRNTLLLVLDNSTSVTLEVKPNSFSIM